MSIHRKIQIYDLKQFSNVIIYVGGNDASQRIDNDLFEECYEQLINYVKTGNPLCTIFLCNSCPRGDVDVSEFNMIMQEQCDVHNTKYIDTYSAYFDNGGQLRSYFYQRRDNIHLSSSGTKRLLGTINKHIPIVDNFDQCVRDLHNPKPQQYRRQNYWNSSTRNQGRQNDRDPSTKDQRQPSRPDGTHNAQHNGHAGGEANWYREGGRQNGLGQQRTGGDRCIKCGLENHNTSECRHTNQLQCFKCKLMGHKGSICWNV